MNPNNVCRVPFLHITASIRELWENEAKAYGDVDGYTGPLERWLSNTNHGIQLKYIAYENTIWYAYLFSETYTEEDMVGIGGVTVCESDDPNVEGFHYRPVFAKQETEDIMAVNKQIQTMTHPTIGVGVVIKRGKEILLSRRTKGPINYLNRLSNFGGALELNETLSAAVIREVKEECGIELSLFDLEGPIHVDHSVITGIAGEGIYNAHSSTYFVEISEDVKPKNMEPEKALNFGWYDIQWLLDHPEECTPLLEVTLRKNASKLLGS